MIKVWDWSRTDRHSNPINVRTSRAVPSHLRSTPATALAVHENKVCNSKWSNFNLSRYNCTLHDSGVFYYIYLGT